MSDLDQLIANIDALVDWQMTESPAAKIEHGPRCLPAAPWIRLIADGLETPILRVRLWLPGNEGPVQGTLMWSTVMGALREDDDGAGVLREDDPPGRAL